MDVFGENLFEKIDTMVRRIINTGITCAENENLFEKIDTIVHRMINSGNGCAENLISENNTQVL